VKSAKCFKQFVKIFNEFYLFCIDFALCLTLDILASLVNAFFLVHDSENAKFGSLNSRARSQYTESDDINESKTISRYKVIT
jgi:hypothetical protein